MPNYCRNRLTVTGPAPELTRFLRAAHATDAVGREQPLSLHSLFPLPSALNSDVSAENENPDRANAWRAAHWGTKWDVWGVALTRCHTQKLRITFLSAWAAPEAAFTDRIALAFPTLTFALHMTEEDGSATTDWRWQQGTLQRRRDKRSLLAWWQAWQR